jgi:hypothetical protein
MKNMQGHMTPLGPRLENAWPQVYASGCIGGGTRGASVKELFVWTLLLMCDVAVDERSKRNGLKLYLVTGLFYYCPLGFSQCWQWTKKKSEDVVRV